MWNKLAAVDECNVTAHPTSPPCLWANDGSTDEEKWAQRRHLGKLYEIAATFAQVFGPGAVPSRVRPIYAEWPLFPARYNDTLTWAATTYGVPPSSWLYGMAITGYYGEAPKGDNATLSDVYDGYTNSSDTQVGTRTAFAALAKGWGLKLVAYEAGPGWDVGSTNSVGTVILAQRFPPMRAAVAYDVLSSWVPSGGGEYNYFSSVGVPSRYGQWGAAESFFNASTPKLCALRDLTGADATPGCEGW